METVKINQEPVPLYQVLKLANLVMGGGEAKIVITNGYVALNDEVVFEKRRKVYSGDVVTFDEQKILVEYEETRKEKKNTRLKDNKTIIQEEETDKMTQNNVKSKGKKTRKPISF